MAKLGQNTRNIAGNATAKTTAPEKTIKNKVQKVRVNVRNVKKSIQTNGQTSKTNSIESIEQNALPKTRLCFIKLRRSTYNSKNNTNNNTLQAQCSVNDRNQSVNIEMKERSLEESEKKVNNVVGKVKTNRNNNINKAIQNTNKVIANEKALNGQTINNTKAKTKNEASVRALDIDANNETCRNQNTENFLKRCIKLKSTGLHKSGQNKKQPVAKHVKNKGSQRVYTKTKGNIAEPSTPSTAKRCVVKLQRTPFTPKAKDIVTHSTTRSCVVKLKKTHVTPKTRDIVIVPITPSTTRKCVVKLQRIPISNTKKGGGKYTEIVSSSYLCTIPVIDKAKRDNFRKLSLTKSARKSSESNENETVRNLNLQDDQQKNKLESKTVQISNNLNALTTNHLKDHKYIKHVAKLSLKRLNGKNNKNLTKNSELTQFEHQLNSTLCFVPARNSTLLEPDFTKDKNKEITKENFKEVTPSKDKSSSQNLANKTDEIENILNSLDEDDVILLKSQDKRNENEAENNKDSHNENEAQKNVETKKQNNILTSENPTNKFFNRKNGKIKGKKLKLVAPDTKTKAVKIVETLNDNSSHKMQTNKFFHRKKEEAQENILKNVTDPKIKPLHRPLEVKKKRRVYSKRSTVVKRDNIYEFLSQSQTTDSDGATKHTDPTADIIKKLIDQGKVRVATNCKGKGKPKFKRRAPPKKIKKIKQTADKKLKQLKNNQKKATTTKVHEIIDDDMEHIDNFENYELTPDDDYNMENERPEVSTKRLNNHKNINHAIDQEGTFSALARTVLINEAGRSNLQRKNELIKTVKKYVSTPINKQRPSAETALEANLSPIPMQPLRPETKASPWRVDEDAYLPRTFNFSRSSGNLPSFSSDFIPSTPIKKKPQKHVIMQEQTSITSNRSSVLGNQNSVPNLSPLQSLLHSDVENIQSRLQTPNENQPPVLSSFSSNDSNAENMPPHRATLKKNNDNENIFDLKQLPNPRKALNYRNPLTSINILEVVTLPPYKHAKKTCNSKPPGAEAVEMFGFEENFVDESLQEDQNVQNIEPKNLSQQAVNNKETNNHCKENLFGFEDFLSQTELSSQEHEETNYNETAANGQNQTIHDKLQNLRKFKPPENELQISLLKGNFQNHLRPINLFNADSSNADGMRQRGIKEMLSSTLINPEPSTSKEAVSQFKQINWKHSKRPNFDAELDVSELFKDPIPETTFNENDAHRTYTRPYKRKRRLKQNKYVMFLDSDESDDEHNSGEQRKHQHSHETNDTSSEKAPKKKRQRKEPKEKPELTEFVEEFKEMCKEVDSYELIVEQSA